jgi:insulysin
VWTRQISNPAESNSALSYYMHAGRFTDPSTRIIVALTAQILSEPAFNILRTEEQLGYVVMCSVRTLAGGGVGGIRILIQSEETPIFLEQRVDAFLEHMKTVIESMDAQQFEEQKFGLEQKWREEPKQLGEEVENYWVDVDNGYLDFYRRKVKEFRPWFSVDPSLR